MEVYNENNADSNLKSTIKYLTSQLIDKLENWKDLKPDRCIMEDFFKTAKDAFWFMRIRSYTVKSNA